MGQPVRNRLPAIPAVLAVIANALPSSWAPFLWVAWPIGLLASTINASVCKSRGWHRYNTVDLARIARSPDSRDQRCLRAVLRIARDYLVPLWLGTYPNWDARSADLCGQPQIEAVSSTSLPGT